MQTGHAAAVASLAFSNDGKIVASGSVDSTIKLWDPATGHQLAALQGHDGTVTSLEPIRREVAAQMDVFQ